MSNIFNLLDGIAESGRGQVVKPTAQPETLHETKLNSLKAGMGGAKPKGLSIRTKSDMNISQSTHSVTKKNTCVNKEHGPLLQVTQTDYSGRPVSPGKETKKLIANSSKSKESVLKETTVINKNTAKQLNEGSFKKPLPPTKNIKQSSELEKLAYWCDDQHKFDYGYIETTEKRFKDLFSKGKENMKSIKEKELKSETPVLLEVPEMVFDRSIEEHNKSVSINIPLLNSEIIDLPEISYDEYYDV